jgi:hypothetical protein
MPLITGPGYYMTRMGRRMWVSPNKTGWLDGLPFCVTSQKGKQPEYTVNEEGFLYPDDHPMYRDREGDEPHPSGMWQPDLFPRESKPRYMMRDDLIQHAK